MIRKIYLKIATQILVFAAILNAAVKAVWKTPLTMALEAHFRVAHYRTMVLVAAELLGLFVFYKLLSVAILWAFDHFQWVRVLVDRLFDVEGSYLESVYINGELEVVGINHVAFADGELKVDSELRWPQLRAGQNIVLTVCARTKSIDELCTSSSELLQYVFQDTYTEKPTLNKTGLTKLTLHRERTPSLLRRLFGHPAVETYSGSFDSFDHEIRGVIQGRRLKGKEAREALAADDQARQRMLVNEVQRILASGTKLRTQPPGMVVSPPATGPSA